MNITNNINILAFNNRPTDEEKMKKLGFKKYERNIHFFLKENKNVYNIDGNNIITKICCLITNKSVIETFDNKRKTSKFVYDKTTYLCDVEFPKHCSVEVIKKNIKPFIESAKIIPTYAFSNNHCIVEEDINKPELDKLYDFGLTMVDINLSSSSSYGLINFSDNKHSDPVFKEIVYSNDYNPRYYNHFDAKAFKDENETRECSVGTLYDSHTTVEYSVFDSDVSTLVNGQLQETYCVDKRLISVNEFITSFFNKWMFVQFESAEIIFDTRLDKPLGITKLNTFYPFHNLAKDHFVDILYNDIVKTFTNLHKTLDEDFYMVLYLNPRKVIVDITFFDAANKQIRIVKPLYKLYGEFALDSEEIINEIESNSEFAKSDMLDMIESNVTGLQMVSDISSAIQVLDSAAQSLIMSAEDSKMKLTEMIGSNQNRKCIENK